MRLSASSVLVALPVCLLLVSPLAVSGFPNGAPPQACQSMTPSPAFQHHDSEPQPRDTFKYPVKCVQRDANTISVQVGEMNGPAFRGVLVSVRDSMNNPKGQLTVEDTNKFKTVCGGRAGTHQDRSEKRLARFTVKLNRPDMVKKLNCVYTVVDEKTRFWVQHTVPLKKLPRNELDRGKKFLKKAVRPKQRQPSKKRTTKRKNGNKKFKKSKMSKNRRQRRSLTRDIHVRTKRSLQKRSSAVNRAPAK